MRDRTDDALTEERQESLAFWADELRDASHDMPLPGLARPGARRRHHGGQLRQSIGADLAQRLRGHARERGLTPFSTLLGLFAELLRRHSGRSQMVVGTAVGNRPRGYEDAVGMFVNTIPLRLRLDPRAPAEDTMDEVTDTLIRALPHQDVPVQELTRVLGMHTSGADNPLFSVMFSAHDASLPEIDVPGLDITLFEGFNTGTTRFDLDVVLLPDDRRGVSLRHGAPGMTLVWDYDADLLGEEVATLLADRFLDLLRAYLDAPATVLADLALPATPVQATEVVAVDDADPLDPAAAHDPSLPALLIGARRLTYGDLDEQVSSLARRMHAAGVRAGQPVAAVLPRGAASVVALLACLRTGAVYCPLSPSDPASRLELLLDRLGPALVLTTADAGVTLPAHLPTADIDTDSFPAARPADVVPGAAYIIHTSGSTGIPKPVAVGRAALENHLTGAAQRFGLAVGDRALLFAQPSFDVALEEVLPSLYAGACLVVPDREVPTGTELAELLATARVTVANLPTSYFLAVREELRPVLRERRWAPRLLVLGGERIPADALDGFLADTDATVLNVYGVTEAAISSTVHEITRDGLVSGAEVPLGTELPGERIHVLDSALRPCRPVPSVNWPSPAPVWPKAMSATRTPPPPASSTSTHWAASGSTSPATWATGTVTVCCTSSAGATTRSSCAATASSWRRWRPPPRRYSAAARAPSSWTVRPPADPGWSASWRASKRTNRGTSRRCTWNSAGVCPPRSCRAAGHGWTRCPLSRAASRTAAN